MKKMKDERDEDEKRKKKFFNAVCIHALKLLSVNDDIDIHEEKSGGAVIAIQKLKIEVLIETKS